MRRRRLLLAAGIIFVLAIVITGVRLYRSHEKAVAHDQALCRQFRANVAAEPKSVPGTTRAVIIGDSYSSGWELKDPAAGYAPQLAKALGWQATIDGFPGSGYTNATVCGNETIKDRAIEIQPGTPIALIQAGLNDTDDMSGFATAAYDTLGFASQFATTTYVVGPPMAPVKNPADIRSIDGTLATAARNAGARYISTITWQLPYQADRLHLTAAGHQLFAEKLAAAIRAQAP